MNNHKKFLELKDHSVSNETFQLILNNELQMLETHPQPEEADISKYYKSADYISHTNSKRNLFEFLYHTVRNITIKQKIKLINSLQLQERIILDIGCGTGDFLQHAQMNGWDVMGVEPNESARTIANHKTQNNVFEIEKLLDLEANRFDVITLWHVLEHLPNLDDHISILKNLLKPEGRLIIAVPNYKSFDAEYYKSFWAAYDVPRHLWHFSQVSIRKLFLKKNMQVEKTIPMKFDSYYVSMLSEKYKKTSLGFIKGIVIGFVSNLKARHSKEYSSLIYVIKNAN